jgi:predicted secreted hydrolase
MDAIGTLLVDGEVRNVYGRMWFDRQWGRDIVDPRIRWDWFSLRLDGGTDIMLFVFPGPCGSVAFGSYMEDSGQVRQLLAEEFTISALVWWTSPRTGVTYPTRWRIVLPELNLETVVDAVAADQEFDARETSANVYWEGLCTVTGTEAFDSITGIAYVELANHWHR